MSSDTLTAEREAHLRDGIFQEPIESAYLWAKGQISVSDVRGLFAKVDRLRKEVADWEASFALYHQADMRGIALWRAEAPAERELIQPDKGDLVAWLLARLDESEADLAAARAAYREEWDCFDDEAVADLMRTAIASARHERERFKARGGEMDALEAERNDFKEKYEFMVNKACTEELPKYREMGEKLAAMESRAEQAEAERDHLRESALGGFCEDCVTVEQTCGWKCDCPTCHPGRRKGADA